MIELKQSSQIDPKESIVFLLYSRYWYFCKYSHQYTKERTEREKKYFYERLLEEYTLNQQQFLYLEWTIEKIKICLMIIWFICLIVLICMVGKFVCIFQKNFN